MASQNATKQKLCMDCEQWRPRLDFKTKQWELPRNRTCRLCEVLVAAATGTHAPTPVEQHGALGGQSAAAGITDAGAGADAAACDEGAPAKRPRDGDSAAAGHAGQRCALPSCNVLRYNEQAVAGAGGAEVDARRSFVALYAPSVVGTKRPELVLPGGSSVVPAAVFNCPAPEGTQEQWVQMALYGGAFVFGVLADVLEAQNLQSGMILLDSQDCLIFQSATRFVVS